MVNNSTISVTIQTGDRIAQMITHRIAYPTTIEVQQLVVTTRNEQGFGSTEVREDTTKSCAQAHMTNMSTIHSITDSILAGDGQKPYNIWLSTDPFHNRLTIMIDIKGDHPTLGIQTTPSPFSGRLQIQDMVPGTPAAKIPKWRSTLHRAIMLKFNGKHVHNAPSLATHIQAACSQGLLRAQVEVATVGHHAIHSTKGSLHLYYNQLNVIAQHLQQQGSPPPTIRLSDNKMENPTSSELGTFLTWKKIKKRKTQ